MQITIRCDHCNAIGATSIGREHAHVLRAELSGAFKSLREQHRSRVGRNLWRCGMPGGKDYCAKCWNLARRK